MAQLKVGDRVYRKSRAGIVQILKIERVTKTQAISGNFKFRQDNLIRVSKIGKEVWDVDSYELENPELINEYNLQTTLTKVLSIDFKKLSIEQLNKIIEIIN